MTQEQIKREPSNWQEQSKELFGEWGWKLILAHCSGFSKRTIQRWCSGEYQIPDWVVNKINTTYDLWKVNKNK